ncbi:MFS transporter [Mangrovihabitans endophyticus]|uniref:Membrane protein n=1 Tax=Mangrovihabitans endophyticus TaxID=1751298 RepID=A0A8J3FL90_9ACTN|nr:MFS transporter [Mangrovihabitans endophyticus]GGK75261.1 membrane protein [Mangrovihabitans endophyticus]
MTVRTPPDPSPAASRPWVIEVLRAQLVPVTRIGRQLAAVSFLDAFGSGMYYACFALYFTQVVGLSAAQVGTALSVGGLAGLLGAVPVGLLADRFRVGRIYIGLQLLRGVCYAALCLVGSFPWFVAVAAVIGLTDSAIPPVHQAVVGVAVPGKDRVDTMARIRAVRNMGFGLGALIAVLALGQGSRAGFLMLIAGNAVSYFVMAAVLAVMGIAAVAVAADAARRPTFRLVRDVRYLLAAAVYGVLAVHATLLSVAVPLWFARHTLVPPVFIGFLVALNTVLAVLLQARFARPCVTLSGARTAAILAGLSLAGFGVASQMAHAVTVEILAVCLAFLAVILLTFGELWHSASSWTVSYELAEPDRRTAYLSTFQLGVSLQAVLAPWAITEIVFGTPGGWLMFGAVTIAAGLVPRLALRRALFSDSA